MRQILFIVFLLIAGQSLGQTWKIKPKQIGGGGTSGMYLVTDPSGFGSWATDHTIKWSDTVNTIATQNYVLRSSFGFRTTIPGGADLNTYTTTGFYLQPSNTNASTGTNYPTARAGILDVEYASSIHILQKYTTYQASSIQPDGTWFRYQYNGAWSVWRRVWSNGDFTTADIANWNSGYTLATSAFPTSFLNTLNSATYNGDLLTVPVGSYSALVSTSATNRPFTNVGGLISFGSSVSNASTRILGARDNSDNLWFQSGDGTGAWRQLASRDWVNANFPALSNAFVQNGNSFGANATVGTNDNFPLLFETNSIQRGGFGNSTTNGCFFIGPIGATSTVSFYNTSPITGGGVAYGNFTNTTVQSDVTTTAYGYRTAIGTQAASFTLPALAHFSAIQGTIGAGSSVTTQYGFAAEGLTGATNNFGFWGNIASGAGRWNLYMNGSANNYLNGATLIGSTTDNGIDKLQVTGSISSNSSLRLLSDHFYSTPAYSYSTGILVSTDIPVSTSTMFELYITGNSYTNTLPINTQIQGYMYSVTPALLQCKGINYGQPITSVDVFVDANNFVCFWLQQTSASNTLRFRLSTGTNNARRITSITNVARPAGTTLDVTVTPINAQTTQINGSGFVKANGTGLSYDNNTYFPLLPTGGTGASINATGDDWNTLRSGFGYGTGLNKPNGTNSHFLTIRSNSDAYGAQIGMRNTRIAYRGLENGVWTPWFRLWHDGDFTSTDITNWNTAYTNRITSLTTTGTGGTASLSGNILNIPAIPLQVNLSGGTGIGLSGSYPNLVISADYTIPLWNASQLQGAVVNGATPTTNQVLQFISGQWRPVTPPWTTNTGTVTSVGLTVPTGLTITSGSPVTAAGTIAVGLQSGYSIPTTADQATWTAKQNALVSGTNIKTINGQSLLGSGNISTSQDLASVLGTGYQATSNLELYNAATGRTLYIEGEAAEFGMGDIDNSNNGTRLYIDDNSGNIELNASGSIIIPQIPNGAGNALIRKSTGELFERTMPQLRSDMGIDSAISNRSAFATQHQIDTAKKNIRADIAAATASSSTVYRCLFSYDAVNGLVVNVLENNTGQTFTWSRTAAGTFETTETFNQAKTFILTGADARINQALVENGPNNIRLSIYDNNLNAWDEAARLPIEIRIYP